MPPFSYELCKHDFLDAVVADIFRSIQGRAFGGAFVQCFCAIDYMGLAMNPALVKNTSAEFQSFVSKYLTVANPAYSNLQDELWAVRNSLIHTYGQSMATRNRNVSLRFTAEEPGNHLSVVASPLGSKTFHLNLPDFVGELVTGIELFFKSSVQNLSSLETWHSQLLLIRSLDSAAARLAVHTGGLKHGVIHPWLSALDITPALTALELSAAVTERVRNGVAAGA